MRASSLKFVALGAALTTAAHSAQVKWVALNAPPAASKPASQPTSTPTPAPTPVTPTTAIQPEAPANSSTVEWLAHGDIRSTFEAGQGDFTPSQINAVWSAELYNRISGWSREGLIDQLSSDIVGYSVSDATAAVDSLNVDWNNNAARKAREYLRIMGFSCKGLIEQLSARAGDKFTVAQATYGAQQAGVC